MELIIKCPICGCEEHLDYKKGVLDSVLYDEPRFPGVTIYPCPLCSSVIKVGSGLPVFLKEGDSVIPIKVKTDDYEMLFSVEGSEEYLDISQLEAFVERVTGCGSSAD